MTKYIPSVSGAEFVVKVSLSTKRIRKLKSKSLEIGLSVDGKLVEKYLWDKNDDVDFITIENIIVATSTGPFIKPFLFSKIVTSKSGPYH